MKRLMIAGALTVLFTIGCGGEGAVTTETTATTDTAARAGQDKDFATRVGDTVGTATANADEMRKNEDARVDEVNEAMDE